MKGHTILGLALCLGLPLAASAADEADAFAAVALKTRGLRTSGPVSVSLQHEVDAAVDRGRAWLVACQNADGSWGAETSCVPLTALSALALARNASAEEKRALDKAGPWLLAPGTTNPVCGDIEDLTWRELALQAVLFPHPPRTAAFFHDIQECEVTQAVPPFARMLIQDAVPCQLGKLSSPAATNTTPAASIFEDCLREMPAGNLTAPSPEQRRLLTRLAADWSGQGVPLSGQWATMRQYWVLAHFINRAGGGSLADEQGRVVDWRNDLARRIVAAQTIDATKQGNGFWRAETIPTDWASQVVAETAFALLTLDEL